MVEKPIATNLETARKMMEAAHSAGIQLGVVSQHRFDDSTQFLKQAIADGRLGKIIQADAYVKWYRSAEYYSRPIKGSWAGEGGGALINQAIHQLDVLLYLMGPLDRVSAAWQLGAAHPIESEDVVNALLTYANGATGVLQASTALWPGYPERIEIHGTKGSAIVTGDKLTRWDVQDDTGDPAPIDHAMASGASDPMAISTLTLERQFLDFGDACATAARRWFPPIDGYRALQAVISMYEFMSTGVAPSRSIPCRTKSNRRDPYEATMKSRSITGRDPCYRQCARSHLENGRIRAIIPSPIEEAPWLSPGFIDLQVNGYLGSDANADDVDADVILSLTKKMLALGVTTFLPTLITASEEENYSRAAADRGSAAKPIRSSRMQFPLCTWKVRSFHPTTVRAAPMIESTFVRQIWRNLNDGRQHAMVLLGWSPCRLTMTAALGLISALADKGVVVAIGHSDATPAQIHAATDAGATLSTHLGNGLGSPLPRHPNLLWAQLADDRLAATFIADGHHLPTDTLKSMLRAKDISRSILVSDVVSLGGMPVGMYQADVGGAVEVTADGRVISASGGSFLAGAYRPLPVGIAHAASIDGVSLGGAIQMATENPWPLCRSQWNPAHWRARPILFSSNGRRNNRSPARSKYEPYMSPAKKSNETDRAASLRSAQISFVSGRGSICLPGGKTSFHGR